MCEVNEVGALCVLGPRGWAGLTGSLVSCLMAHNPQAPQGPEGNHDPAGSTQMFRAFVDEGVPQQAQRSQPAAARQQSGSKTGLIVGVVVVIVILAAVAWLALG
jgi:hypothetical protein